MPSNFDPIRGRIQEEISTSVSNTLTSQPSSNDSNSPEHDIRINTNPQIIPQVTVFTFEDPDDDFLDLEAPKHSNDQDIISSVQSNQNPPYKSDQAVRCEQKREHDKKDGAHDFYICDQAACVCPKIPKMSSEFLDRTKHGKANASVTVELFNTSGGVSTSETKDARSHDVMSYCSVQNLFRHPMLSDGYLPKLCVHRNSIFCCKICTKPEPDCSRSLGNTNFPFRLSNSNEDIEQEMIRNVKRAPMTVIDSSTDTANQNESAPTALCSFRFCRRDRTQLVVQKLSPSSDGYSVQGLNSLASVGTTLSDPQPLRDDSLHSQQANSCSQNVEEISLPNHGFEFSEDDDSFSDRKKMDFSSSDGHLAGDVNNRVQIYPLTGPSQDANENEKPTFHNPWVKETSVLTQSWKGQNDNDDEMTVHDNSPGSTVETSGNSDEHNEEATGLLQNLTHAPCQSNRDDQSYRTPVVLGSLMPPIVANYEQQNAALARNSFMTNTDSSCKSECDNILTNVTTGTQTDFRSNATATESRQDTDSNTDESSPSCDRQLSSEESTQRPEKGSEQCSSQAQNVEQSIYSGLHSLVQFLNAACAVLQNSNASRFCNHPSHAHLIASGPRDKDERPRNRSSEKRRKTVPRWKPVSHNRVDEGHPLRQYWKNLSKNRQSGGTSEENKRGEDGDAVDSESEREPQTEQTASSLELERNLRLANATALQNMTSGSHGIPRSDDPPATLRKGKDNTGKIERGKQRKQLDTDSGSGYCSSRPSVRSVSASRASPSSHGSNHDDFQQKGNTAARDTSNRADFIRKPPAVTKFTPVIVGHDSLDVSATAVRPSKHGFVPIDDESPHKLKRSSSESKVAERSDWYSTKRRSKTRSRSPLRKRPQNSPGHSNSSLSSAHNSFCRRSACARRVMDRSSSEDSSKSLSDESDTSSKHSVTSSLSQLDIAHESRRKEFRSSKKDKRQSKRKATYRSKKRPNRRACQQESRYKVSSHPKRDPYNKLSEAEELAFRQSEKIEICRGGRDDEFKLKMNSADIDMSKRVEKNGTPGKCSNNVTEISRQSFVAHGFAKAQIVHNCSNNTAILSRSSSKESKSGNNRGNQEEKKPQEQQCPTTEGKDGDKKVNFADDQPPEETLTNNTANTILPVFSFHNTKVQAVTSGTPPPFNKKQPSNPADNSKTQTPPKKDTKAAGVQHTKSKRDVSVPEPRRSKSLAAKKKTFVGPFSGLGSSSQAATNDSATDLAAQDAAPLEEGSPGDDAAALAGIQSLNARPKTGKTKLEESKAPIALGGENAPPVTTAAGDDKQAGARAEAARAQHASDSLEEIPTKKRIPTAKERLYLRARRLLRQICYIKSKEEMLFRAALRLQHFRLQLQEEHSMLFVRAKSSRANEDESLSITSSCSSQSRVERRRSRKRRRERRRARTRRTSRSPRAPAEGHHTKFTVPDDQQPSTSRKHRNRPRSSRKGRAYHDSTLSSRDDGKEEDYDTKTEANESKTVTSGTSVSAKPTKTTVYSRDDEDDKDDDREGDDEDDDDDDDDDESESSGTGSDDDDAEGSSSFKSSAKTSQKKDDGDEESETTDDDSNDPRLCGFFRQT